MSVLVLSNGGADVSQERGLASDCNLTDLTKLASCDIETAMVADLSGELHSLFDPICEDVLPIYFGPLLGRLYLEGL